MMRSHANPTRVALCSLAIALYSGCTTPEVDTPEESIGSIEQEFNAENGVALNGIGNNGIGNNGIGNNGIGNNGIGNNGIGNNGIGNNGIGNNGIGNNGIGNNGVWGNWGSNTGLGGKNGSLVGFAFDRSTLSGFLGTKAINDLWMDGSEIKLTLKNGTIVGNDDVVGAFIIGNMENGYPVILRINEHEIFSSTVGSTLHRYVIEYKTFGPPGFACGKHNGSPIKTIPISGTWNYGWGVPGGGSKTSNPDLLTFACEGFALYKCVDFGYEPWGTVNGESLESYHQSCTRMIRADYCGDGQPHTVDGTIINLYDDIGIQADVVAWPLEAEWDENGARCLSHWRIESMDEPLPCQFEKPAAQCGNPIDWTNTLIVTEAQ